MNQKYFIIVLALFAMFLFSSGCVPAILYGTAEQATNTYQFTKKGKKTDKGQIVYKKMISPIDIDTGGHKFLIIKKIKLSKSWVTLERKISSLKDFYYVFRYYGDIYNPNTKVDFIDRSFTLDGAKEEFQKLYKEKKNLERQKN